MNRDLAATLPDEPPLVLMLCPASGDGDRPHRIHVALSDGRWQGSAVHPQGPGMHDEPDDTSVVLQLVADAAQETVTELRWTVWPVCPYHHIGMHPRPAGTTSGWYRDRLGGGPVVWWCRGHRGDDCHDLAPVGELAAALPGKQRRELRRRARRRTKADSGPSTNVSDGGDGSVITASMAESATEAPGTADATAPGEG
ncbi:hypothetical protein LO771_04775 [Streptacidiphilus sp. ASG 303]|uniref:hypothetical protein n=1 Tax=Streptacidiphilus sp. ASG 303 TaxID=2896847 RepID=UPI001E5E2FFB|nr:hypothetical protein [Streptacidiphilus sp. ASG 303]MCD0481742.1 hypothetical protein [Streptacidiphilus sp. ASG 303]